MRRGLKIVFSDTSCRVYKGKRLLIRGEQTNKGCYGLCKATLPIILKRESAAYEAAVSMKVAHQRLVHIAPSTISKMLKHESALGLKVLEGQEELQCEPCLQGKAHRLPFPKVSRPKPRPHCTWFQWTSGDQPGCQP